MNLLVFKDGNKFLVNLNPKKKISNKYMVVWWEIILLILSWQPNSKLIVDHGILIPYGSISNIKGKHEIDFPNQT